MLSERTMRLSVYSTDLPLMHFDFQKLAGTTIHAKGPATLVNVLTRESTHWNPINRLYQTVPRNHCEMARPRLQFSP